MVLGNGLFFELALWYKNFAIDRHLPHQNPAIMDFMFRIPRSLFSFLLLLAFTPVLLLIYFEIRIGLTGTTPPYQSWLYQNAETLNIVGVLAAILVHTWFLTVIFRQHKAELKAMLLAIPGVLSILILTLITAGFLNDTYQIQVLPNVVFDYLDDLITLNNIEEFVIGSLVTITSALIISTISMIKAIGKGKLDWFLIPLQVLMLPIGIWWLQPKLKASSERKTVEHAKDHLVE